MKTGWAVAEPGHSQFIEGDDWDAMSSTERRRAVVDYIDGVPDDAMIGGWNNPKTGEITLDRVTVLPKDQRVEAEALGRERNQEEIASLDAIWAEDWDNAFVPTGGTGDARAMVPSYGQGTRDDGEAEEAVVGDDRLREGRHRSGDGGSDRCWPEEVFAAHAEVRHPGHPNQKVHGKSAVGRISPAHGDKLKRSGTQVNTNLSVGALNEYEVSDGAGGTIGVGDASIQTLQDLGGVTREQAATNMIRNAEAALERSGGKPPISGEDWYEDEGNSLRQTAKTNGIDQEVGIAMTASLSPMTEWGDNKANAEIVMEAVGHEAKELPPDVVDYVRGSKAAQKAMRKAGVDIEDGDTLDSLYAKDPRVAAIAASRFGPHMKPPRAATAGAGYPPYEKALRLGMTDTSGMSSNQVTNLIDSNLRGTKVRSFRNNLSDPFNSEDITVDTHMIRAATNLPGSRDANWQSVKANATAMTSKPAAPGKAGVGSLPAIADATRTATQEFNRVHGTEYLPSQFQAIVWTEQIAQFPREVVGPIVAGKAAEPPASPDVWAPQYGSST